MTVVVVGQKWRQLDLHVWLSLHINLHVQLAVDQVLFSENSVPSESTWVPWLACPSNAQPIVERLMSGMMLERGCMFGLAYMPICLHSSQRGSAVYQVSCCIHALELVTLGVWTNFHVNLHAQLVNEQMLL